MKSEAIIRSRENPINHPIAPVPLPQLIVRSTPTTIMKLVFRNLILVTTLLAVGRSEFCTDLDGCDISDSPKSEADSSESNEEDQDIDGESTQDSPPQNWDVFSTIQNTVSNAWGTVKHTVQKKTEKYTESVYNTTAEYAEKVRYIFREELSNFLAYFLWESSAVTDPAVGKMIINFFK